MSTITRNRPKIKPTRHTPRPDRPFGAGLLRSLPVERRDHTLDDEQWWACESNRFPEPMARGWEAAFERAIERGEVCCRCGLPPANGDRLTGGHCEACKTDILETEHLDRLLMSARMDVAESPLDAPIFCGICGKVSTVEPDTGLCGRCDSHAMDRCSVGNGGF